MQRIGRFHIQVNAQLRRAGEDQRRQRHELYVRAGEKIVEDLQRGDVSAIQNTDSTFQPRQVAYHHAIARRFVSLSPDGTATGQSLFLSNELRGEGTAGGKSVTNLGHLSVGFDYLRPYWTYRDFTLAVPAGSAGNFPLLGDTGNVDNHFAFAPKIVYKYDVGADLGIQASGTFINLNGNLNRSLSDTASGQGTLNATSSLTIVAANLPEFVTPRLYYGELFPAGSHCHCDALEDLAIILGVGTRYSSLEQSYNSTLTNSIVGGGTNTAQRTATQTFSGAGLTTSMEFWLPVKDNWVVFTTMRGSVLAGDNTKDSNLSITLGTAGTSTTIHQDRTDLIPVGEISVGSEWGKELGKRLAADQPPPLFTIQVALTSQFWGNAGPLTAGSAQAFRTSNLFLVGVHVMVGFQH
jgi:hypothetical protein